MKLFSQNRLHHLHTQITGVFYLWGLLTYGLYPICGVLTHRFDWTGEEYKQNFINHFSLLKLNQNVTIERLFSAKEVSVFEAVRGWLLSKTLNFFCERNQL